jgi:hypothetical protein
MTTLGKRVKLAIIPGVNPLEDSTALNTLLFTDSDKIRFQNGKLRKIGGWQRIFSTNGELIQGAARNIFSCRDQNGNPVTIIGTHTRLYAYLPLQGEVIYNITPLSTDTTAIPNAFTTEYNASVTVEMITTRFSPVVTLIIPNYFTTNDNIQISGVSGTFNGIPGSSMNGTFPVEALSNAAIQLDFGPAATVTGTTSVDMTWASGYLYVNYPLNGLLEGDRIGILASTAVDGIPDTDINIEQLIAQTVDEDTFTIQTGVIATSLVVNGGGADTTIQAQIAPGNPNQSSGYGYGGGLYGVGDYGVSKFFNSSDSVQYPRIWSMDKFGSNLVLTPGDGLYTDPNLYVWVNFDTLVAPVLITTSGSTPVPTGAKWLYVSNSMVCVLGANGINNSMNSSDIGDYTNWTPSGSSYAYSTTLEAAGPLMSQASARNRDLVFTGSDVFQFEFVDKPFIWYVRKLLTTDGIIGPKARAEIEDAVFWQGQGDFYVFDGYTVNILPNNTVKRYVYDNINWAESSEAFIFANVEFNEIWFFYPSGQDQNPNNYVMYNYKESHWTIGTMPRTAAEEPTNVNDQPLMIQSQTTNTFKIPNSINTFFYSLEPDPLTTVMSSDTISAAVAIDAYLVPGDKIFVSDATDTNGILAADINGERTITSATLIIGYGAGLYGVGLYGTAPIQAITFTAGSAATSSGSGGGSAVTIGTSILGIETTLTNLNVGDTISITSATAVDGFSAASVNSTSPILYINGSFVQINIDTPGAYSTSSVIEGGGPNVTLSYIADDWLFQHEVGVNDYNPLFNPAEGGDSLNQYAAMLSYATTFYGQIGEGDNTMLIYSFYPDLKLEGDFTLGTNLKLYAQSPLVVNVNSNFQAVYTITPSTTKVDVMMVGRQRQYHFQSFELNGNFMLGNCYEEIKESSTR